MESPKVYSPYKKGHYNIVIDSKKIAAPKMVDNELRKTIVAGSGGYSAQYEHVKLAGKASIYDQPHQSKIDRRKGNTIVFSYSKERIRIYIRNDRSERL